MRDRVLLALLGVTGLGGTIMSWLVAHHSLIGVRWELLLLGTVWLALGLVGAWAATRVRSNRVAFGLVLLITVLTRLAAATGPAPSISNDVYRYGWDAHVQLSGIDPYRYPPDAPALRALRSDPWWPAPAQCRDRGDRPGCTTMNRPGVRTIYPAVAEGWFDLVSLVGPSGDGIRPYQVAAGLVDDATVVALLIALRRTGHNGRRVAWYALSPIPVIEFAGNGHVDGLALLFLVAALIALQRGRRGVAGVLIGLATMVKLYPAAALIAGWRRGGGRMVGAAIGVAAATELPHLLAVGTRILGYLPGYLKEEHYSTGGRFLLLGLLPLHGDLLTGLAVAGVIAAAVWVVRSRIDPAAGLAVILTATILITTPVQPWYAVVVAGIGVLVEADWLFLLPLAGEPYYAVVILNDRHQVAAGRISYGIAGVAVAFLAWRRLRSPRLRASSSGDRLGGVESDRAGSPAGGR